TRAYYAARGEQPEIIKLYGSMELAPLAGLADRIVDLVDTGRTLRENGLVEIATIADISARLIVNKAAMKVKHAAVRRLIAQLRGAVRLRARDAGFQPALAALLERGTPADDAVDAAVRDIIQQVRARGDEALIEYTNRFDRRRLKEAAALEIPGPRLAQ